MATPPNVHVSRAASFSGDAIVPFDEECAELPENSETDGELDPDPVD